MSNSGTNSKGSPPKSGRVAIVGCGTVGARAARQLLSAPSGGSGGERRDEANPKGLPSFLGGSSGERRDEANPKGLPSFLGVSKLVLVDTDPLVAAQLSNTLGSRAETAVDVHHAFDTVDAVLIATPADQYQLAADCVRAGVPVVATTDSVRDVELILGLHAEALRVGVPVVVSAGFAPGLTDVLAVHAAGLFEVVREVHTAKLGTAGPACARQHHAALSSESVDWRDGAWLRRPGGSGRELVWFPDPIGGADCYRAAVPDALLLHRLFPEAERLSGRVAATRRDRLTSRLPMMRKPHAEAGPGAVRVEVRGSSNGEENTVILACMDRPSVAAGSVAAVTVGALISGLARRADTASGVFGLGQFVDSTEFLRELATRGVRCARFEGTTER